MAIFFELTLKNQIMHILHVTQDPGPPEASG